ncbi:hypothetical protein KQX54_005350 [Cotesia glomerata]|uniref:Uncharacterized protein n=1 Tax=Cotesia glomerata TaxID=32391 RepID=A0AAV7J4X2_COTGL|nr:hypothetical protein KQX54_005350 [Cotesia glomerata]
MNSVVYESNNNGRVYKKREKHDELTTEEKCVRPHAASVSGEIPESAASSGEPYRETTNDDGQRVGVTE